MNHMGIKKTCLLTWKSVYWINLNAYIEKTVKQCSTCLDYQHTVWYETALHYDIPYKPWEVVDADIFMILCTVDNNSKFPLVKKVANVSADDLLHATKMTFAEFGLSWKIISDVGTNFTSETFKKFWRKLNIQQSIMPSFHHQSNGQVC